LALAAPGSHTEDAPGSPPGASAFGSVALLGTAGDEVIAQRIGRTDGAVMQMRQALEIAVFRDRRRGR
jgi:hypothetical protein